MTCFSRSCSAPATAALYIGSDWPDGRRRYVLACAGHVDQVVDYQATLGVRVEVASLEQVELVPDCVACWRSHGCDLPGDHNGIHVCMPGDCDSSPTEDDHVFTALTFEPCARLGGVPRRAA